MKKRGHRLALPRVDGVHERLRPDVVADPVISTYLCRVLMSKNRMEFGTRHNARWAARFGEMMGTLAGNGGKKARWNE